MLLKILEEFIDFSSSLVSWNSCPYAKSIVFYDNETREAVRNISKTMDERDGEVILFTFCPKFLSLLDDWCRYGSFGKTKTCLLMWQPQNVIFS
jgi:hypothetical protein